MATTVTETELEALNSEQNNTATTSDTEQTYEGKFVGTLVGNATTAKELEAPYRLTLTGDVSGTTQLNASDTNMSVTVNHASSADTADFAGKTNLAARSTLADMANTAEFSYRAGKLSKLFVNITGACVGSGSATDTDTIDINIDNINVAELFIVGALPEEKANTSRIYVDISNRHFWIYNNDTAKWYDCFEQLETELDNHELRIADLEKLDLSNRVTSLETRATANDVTVADFEKRITANASDIDAVEDRTTNLETNVKTNTDNISALDTRVTATETSITKLDQRVDNIETSTDVGALATKITSIEEKNTEQDASIKTNSDAIKTNSDAIKTNSDAIKTNSDAIKTNSDAIKTNSDAITALNTSVATQLETQNSTVETKLSNFTTTIDEKILAQNTSVTNKIDEFTTSITNQLNTQNTDVTNKLATVVTLTDDQTITGAKDFTGGLTATSPDSSASGTEVVTAEWVRANKKQGGDADYIASLTASDDFFRRPSLFECDKRSVTLPAKLEVKINGTIYKTTETHTISISDFGTQAGKDFYIYACVPADADSTEPDFVISQNSTVPTDYTAENSRKIGGFHTLCASVGTLKNVDPLIKSSTSVAHKLSGYVTGDILPASRWDLWHRPKVSPEGYVYCGGNGCDVWVSIYLLSWDGSKLVSKYNAVTADGGSSKVWHGELFSDAMQAIGGRLPYRREFARFAFGSNEATNIYGSADKTYTGGHTDTSSRRMISDIGCEDCCGYLWQWSEELGFCGASGWSASTYSSSVDPISRGNSYGGLYRLGLGGDWDDGSSCGSRSARCDGVSSFVYADLGGRGASEPLHRDALTVTGYPV